MRATGSGTSAGCMPRASAMASFSAGRVHPIVRVEEEGATTMPWSPPDFPHACGTARSDARGISRTLCETFPGKGAASGRAIRGVLLHVVVGVQRQHRARRRPDDLVGDAAPSRNARHGLVRPSPSRPGPPLDAPRDRRESRHWTTVLATGRYEEIHQHPEHAETRRRVEQLFLQRRAWWLPAAGKVEGREHAEVGPLGATGQSACGNFLARRENLHVILTCVPGGLGKYGDALRVSAGTIVAR